MDTQQLVEKNPLRLLEGGPVCESMRLGLVVARAGLGKTALLVQIAMDAILLERRVIHISIGQGIDKTCAWYTDIVREISQNAADTRALLDLVKQRRMIMTFKVSAFSRPKLEERLNDLVLQDIFRPSCLVIEGFDFVKADHSALEDLRELMEVMNIQAWFSVVSHRDDPRESSMGVPAPCHEMEDLFDTVIQIKPDQQMVRLNIIKDCGKQGKGVAGLALDPATMMLVKA
ncbi:MAG: hypothetical protein BWK76_00580 [Desulfobulbaceae bacterium A2]|nr:MAG: hypothetical protein BWK76_00580 [Desulfobulbaceae bacterium A2]